MPFFKLKHRTKSPPASKIRISKPLPSASECDLSLSSDHPPSPNTMDNEHRGTLPTPFKLGGSYQPLNRPVPLGRIPSSPLPALPTYDSGDDPGSPNNYSDSEVGFARGVAKFERVRTESHESSLLLLSPTKSPIGRISADIDELTQFVPMSTSPPKLRLSFESNITEAGSVYDLDTPPNHRASLKAALKKPAAPTARQSSPERIITSPAKIAQPTVNTDPRSRQKASSNGPAQLRRSSALYSKRPPSNDGTDASNSIKSGKSTTENPEDRDSGFHEDFDEALRSKPPSPDKQLFDAKTNNLSHQRDITASPDRMTVAPERAPLIPSEDRITPITLTDPGVTAKPKRVTLPQIEKMETFKETFSTNLFENTISPDAKRNVLLSPKPIVSATKGKVLTPTEFEKLRQQEEDESEDDEEEEDVARDESYQVDLAKQRQRQQAALSIYRQQMTKVVGATSSPKLKPERPASQFGGIPEVDESDEIPLGILIAHGFPQTSSRPSSSESRDRSMSLDAKRTSSPGNLPVFAKNLPSDPHARGLPRSTSAYDLRPSTSASLAHAGGRTASAPAVPLLDTYRTRQRKGASYMGPNVSFDSRPQIMGNEQSYFSQVPGQYDMMGMQPIHNQGLIQYVPVMVSPHIGSPIGSPMGSPQLTPMQQPTLMHELQGRQQYGMQQHQRMSQYAPQPPPHIHPVQRFPQGMQSRPQSIYPTSRQSVYDQRSIFSLSSQQPTPRPKLPSTNPAYRLSTVSSNSSQPGRYRASIYDTSGLGVKPQLRMSASEDDEGWEGLKRKKEQMQARRMTRLQAA